MLTVDQVRNELEMVPKSEIDKVSTSYKRSPEWLKARLNKVCHNHPDRKALIAKSGRSLGQCGECISAARKLGSANRLAKLGKRAKLGPKLPEGPKQMIDKAHFVGTAAKLPPPAPVLKIYCMRCGFHMEIPDPLRIF